MKHILEKDADQYLGDETDFYDITIKVCGEVGDGWYCATITRNYVIHPREASDNVKNIVDMYLSGMANETKHWNKYKTGVKRDGKYYGVEKRTKESLETGCYA